MILSPQAAPYLVHLDMDRLNSSMQLALSDEGLRSSTPQNVLRLQEEGMHLLTTVVSLRILWVSSLISLLLIATLWGSTIALHAMTPLRLTRFLHPDAMLLQLAVLTVWSFP